VLLQSRYVGVMENRRNHYRHSFPAESPLPVEVVLPGRPAPLAGQTTNLSISGIALRLAEEVTDLAPAHLCRVNLALPHSQEQLSLSARVIYARQTEGRSLCGLSFLSLASETANEERERAIWLFLLDEQRRQRRDRDDLGKQAM
jgi:c-di-GMP-binding flagellar brake protein YcgR